MHKSRLCAFLIDCDPDRFDRGLEFWSRALGRPPVDPPDPPYRSLRGRFGGEGGLVALVQRVPPGEVAIHLDIETDDVEAEVARLERLGARRKRSVKGWVVMEAPSGHAFCVVPVHRDDFEAGAQVWDE